MSARRVLLVVCALAIGLGACTSTANKPSPAPPRVSAASSLESLDRMAELRAAFNADRGRPRLLLLLSPT